MHIIAHTYTHTYTHTHICVIRIENRTNTMLQTYTRPTIVGIPHSHTKPHNSYSYLPPTCTIYIVYIYKQIYMIVYNGRKPYTIVCYIYTHILYMGDI